MKRTLANERYTGKLIFGQTVQRRRPGTHQKVERRLPREQWLIHDHPELRIVSEDLWERVRARQTEARARFTAWAVRSGNLMRGRDAALHSKYLFSGFMRCGVCGGFVTTVAGGGGQSRYGCAQSARNGVSTCPNRLTIRARIADAHLLAGLQHELLKPETVRYISEALTAELKRLVDRRPQELAEARTTRDRTAERLRRLVEAIEQGVAPLTLAAAMHEREAELQQLDAAINQLSEPLRDMVRKALS